MPFLVVPEASLYYTRQGSGPTLLLVPGGNGDAHIFADLTAHLHANFTVVTYDRRGYSRSAMHDCVAHSSVSADASDAAALLREVSPGQPSYVLATSSGVIVALELVTKHPALVEKAIVHEPSACLMREPARTRQLAPWRQVTELYRWQGLKAASALFACHIGSSTEIRRWRSTIKRDQEDQLLANRTRFFEHELLHYTLFELDTGGLMRVRDKIVPALGDGSTAEIFQSNTRALGDLVAKEIESMPGMHLGYIGHPESFARVVRKIFDVAAK